MKPAMHRHRCVVGAKVMDVRYSASAMDATGLAARSRRGLAAVVSRGVDRHVPVVEARAMAEREAELAARWQRVDGVGLREATVPSLLHPQLSYG